jgi:hypothetical protein
MNWMDLTQDRIQRQALVLAELKFWVIYLVARNLLLLRN